MLRSTFAPLLLGFFVLFAASAQAKTSIYATAGIANYGFTNVSSASNFIFKGDTGSFGGGAFYNFPIQSRVTVGVDGRLEYSPGYKGGFLAGTALRVGVVPHKDPLRPYFQIGAGVVHSSYTDVVLVGSGFNSSLQPVNRSVTNGAAQLVFGLDIRLTDHYDVRALELGAESSGGDSVRAGAGFLDAGVVYHFHPTPRS